MRYPKRMGKKAATEQERFEGVMKTVLKVKPEAMRERLKRQKEARKTAKKP